MTDFSTGGIPLLILDLETAPAADAREFFEDGVPPEAPALNASLKDPEKIAADKAAKHAKYLEMLKAWGEAEAERFQSCAVNPDLAQIVALGFIGTHDNAIVWTREEYPDERDLIKVANALIGPATIVCGFNVRFDLSMLMRRALYTGASFPRISLDKYRASHLLDLQDILTFNGYLPTKGRSLDFYKRRLRLDVPADEIDGSDVPRLFAEGTPDAWQKIRRHCELDVLTTRLLAERLGVLRPALAEAVGF